MSGRGSQHVSPYVGWRHGTVRGYVQCRKRHIGACQGCIEAHYNAARLRAMVKLKTVFPECFQALYEEELRRGVQDV